MIDIEKIKSQIVQVLLLLKLDKIILFGLYAKEWLNKSWYHEISIEEVKV